MTVLPDNIVYVTNLTKIEAEDLLDWLEANGFGRRELLFTERGTFTVRYWR